MEPAAEPEVAAESSCGFVDTIPSPIIEHILSQLLLVCDSPGAVRRDWLPTLLCGHFVSLTVNAHLGAGGLCDVRLPLVACRWRCCLQRSHCDCSKAVAMYIANRTACFRRSCSCLLRRGFTGRSPQHGGVRCSFCPRPSYLVMTSSMLSKADMLVVVLCSST